MHPLTFGVGRYISQCTQTRVNVGGGCALGAAVVKATEQRDAAMDRRAQAVGQCLPLWVQAHHHRTQRRPLQAREPGLRASQRQVGRQLQGRREPEPVQEHTWRQLCQLACDQSSEQQNDPHPQPAGQHTQGQFAQGPGGPHAPRKSQGKGQHRHQEPHRRHLTFNPADQRPQRKGRSQGVDQHTHSLHQAAVALRGGGRQPGGRKP